MKLIGNSITFSLSPLWNFSGKWIRNRRWFSAAFLVALLVSLPLIAVILYLFIPSGSTWHHLVETVLPRYALNTLGFLAGVGALSLVIGISTAWILSQYSFPGSRMLRWALVLPLSFPTYIIAFSYAGLLGYAGPVFTFFRENFGVNLYFDPLQPWLLVILLALVLFPYVYLPARIAFTMQRSAFHDTARSLGSSSLKLFFQVTLPMARPAIIGGLFLVLMEVLNDYGAMKYFGIGTFTTGIFNAWFSLGDLEAAIKLAGMLLILVLTLLIVERLQRGKAVYSSVTPSSNIAPVKIKGGKAILASIICWIPVFLGFFLPFLFNLHNVWLTGGRIINAGFWKMALNSFWLALAAAFLVIISGVILVYSQHINRDLFSKFTGRIAALGYTLPGAIIAVGALTIFSDFDHFLIDIFVRYGWNNPGLIFTGGLFLLVFAYIVRFLAVGYNPIEGGFQKQNKSLDDAARTLGASPMETLFKVHFPVLRQVLFAAGLLTFVDVIKELPLTLILRPFNFDTLATKAFEYASDERIIESSNASIFIVILGIVPIVLSHFVLKSKSSV